MRHVVPREPLFLTFFKALFLTFFKERERKESD
jgi:hypothetical protein